MAVSFLWNKRPFIYWEWGCKWYIKCFKRWKMFMWKMWGLCWCWWLLMYSFTNLKILICSKEDFTFSDVGIKLIVIWKKRRYRFCQLNDRLFSLCYIEKEVNRRGSWMMRKNLKGSKNQRFCSDVGIGIDAQFTGLKE